MRNQSQRGATLVEAAAVLLLLFTFIFAIIEFGRILSVYQTITNAAREGARFGVAPCESGDPARPPCTYTGPDGTRYSYDPGFLPSNDTITAFVGNYLKAGAVKPDTVVVDGLFQTLDGNKEGSAFSVEHYYRKVEITTTYRWLIFPFGNFPLRANAVMKDELDVVR
jgi:hypothetical protein